MSTEKNDGSLVQARYTAVLSWIIVLMINGDCLGSVFIAAIATFLFWVCIYYGERFRHRTRRVYFLIVNISGIASLLFAVWIFIPAWRCGVAINSVVFSVLLIAYAGYLRGS